MLSQRKPMKASQSRDLGRKRTSMERVHRTKPSQAELSRARCVRIPVLTLKVMRSHWRAVSFRVVRSCFIFSRDHSSCRTEDGSEGGVEAVSLEGCACPSQGLRQRAHVSLATLSPHPCQGAGEPEGVACGG